MLVALVGLSPLDALGLEAALRLCRPDAEVCIAADGLSGAAGRAACFVVSARALASYARFFMPRLDTVMLLSTSASPEAPMLMLSPGASLQEIKEKLTSLMQNAVQAETPAPHPALTAREMEVLRLAAQGRTAKEIAEKLCISTNTVLTHRKNIASKTGLRTVAALTHFAMAHGLLT